MCAGVIVLKFGGSVLTHEQSLRIAVHEIYRWRRRGWQVVAVVSALAGRTDALLGSCRLDGVRADPYATASLLACGERESAARLVGSLDRVGITSSLLDPCAIGLRAHGGALDATPDGLERSRVHAPLESIGCVVVPGFFACDDLGRIVTLGRGGSDLTALVLADALGADRCLLIKDVDGLYERDPSTPGPRPRRYERASYEDVLALDGSIVQHKAVRFARDREIPFEVCGFNSVDSTRVASRASVLTNIHERVRPLRVALLGLGVVGGGVLELVSQMPGRIELIGACVRNPGNHAATLPKRYDGVLSADLIDVATRGADVVVEAVGGIEDARDAIRHALMSGSHVVTANKAVLAAHWAELQELARSQGLSLRFSASVGGGTSVLEAAGRLRATSVRGVLNGTANYVLERLGAGESLEDAIVGARHAGLAEADHSRDLDGRDALDKLRVIASVCDREVERVDISKADVRSVQTGARARQVATLSADGLARVAIEVVEPGDVLDDLPDEWNAAEITGPGGVATAVRGRGAGRWPTAESVLADVLDLERERRFTLTSTSTSTQSTVLAPA